MPGGPGSHVRTGIGEARAQSRGRGNLRCPLPAPHRDNGLVAAVVQGLGPVGRHVRVVEDLVQPCPGQNRGEEVLHLAVRAIDPEAERDHDRTNHHAELAPGHRPTSFTDPRDLLLVVGERRMLRKRRIAVGAKRIDHLTFKILKGQPRAFGDMGRHELVVEPLHVAGQECRGR
jgi:hypothetical protein